MLPSHAILHTSDQCIYKCICTYVFNIIYNTPFISIILYIIYTLMIYVFFLSAIDYGEVSIVALCPPVLCRS